MSSPIETPPPGGVKRSAAGVLYTDPQGRVLLVKPTYKRHWDVPGGVVDPGETWLTAARREVFEELNLRLSVGRLLVVDDLGTMIAAIYDGGTLHGRLDITLPPTELATWQWCTPGQITARLAAAPILTRRVFAAIRARQAGETYYLERGHQQ